MTEAGRYQYERRKHKNDRDHSNLRSTCALILRLMVRRVYLFRKGVDGSYTSFNRLSKQKIGAIIRTAELFILIL